MQDGLCYFYKHCCKPTYELYKSSNHIEDNTSSNDLKSISMEKPSQDTSSRGVTAVKQVACLLTYVGNPENIKSAKHYNSNLELQNNGDVLEYDENTKFWVIKKLFKAEVLQGQAAEALLMTTAT